MLDENRLPLTSSIEADVRSGFKVPDRVESIERSALLAALKQLEPGEQSLEDALLAEGFMAPGGEDAAILRWIDATFTHWNQHYPIETALQRLITDIRPLAATFALTDPRFFVPGGHGLHRFLDALHQTLNGWQLGLGANSDNTLVGVRETLQMLRRDFPSEPQVDSTRAALDRKAQGHQAQLQKLDPIRLEQESATLKDDSARLNTIVAINRLMITHQVPGSVARFLKTDWLESGIMIAHRHGFESDAWQQYSSTSQLLVDAVQPVVASNVASSQRLQQTMQQLPQTLSRQLKSLGSDSDAVSGAVGLIEYALIRNMRGEDMDLVFAEPIKTSGLPESGPPTDEDLAKAKIQPGYWYLIDTPDGPQRIRLVNSLVSNIYLLFMDFSGARACRKSSAEFLTLLKSGEARCIEVADSFCRAMVEASDIQVSEQREFTRQSQDSGSPDAAAMPHPDQDDQRYDGVLAAQQLDTEQPFDAGQPNNVQQSTEKKQSPEPHQTEQGGHTANAEQLQVVLDPGRQDRLPAVEIPYESHTVVKLQIPVGTWLGFHDRDPPVMARVAVRDTEKDSYIFTNREGIKMRELTAAQLIGLIDRDMVDILERKTNFRDTVTALRQEQQERLN